VLGTSVLTPTFRYHPSIVAQAFGTLGAMAPGRVILGIGTGEGLNEVPSTGQPWPEFKERFARMREAVTLIRKLWREERVTFEGEYYKTEKATIYDRPDEEIPIYVAAAGAVVARYAGRTGDGFICTSGKKWDLYTQTLMPSVAEGIGKAAEPKKLPYDNMIEIKLSFDSDKQRALADTRTGGAGAHARGEDVGRGSGRDAASRRRLPVERAASRWIVSTDPDEGGREGRRLCRPGLQALVFHAPGPDQPRFLKLLPSRWRRGCARSSTDAASRVAGRARPADGEGGRRPREPDRRAADRRAGVAARRRAGAGAEDRVQGRGPHGRACDREALAARHRARRRGAEGPASWSS
jgi:coenzyme F420-dependent glucose-6-phosphate dehydrogenase